MARKLDLRSVKYESPVITAEMVAEWTARGHSTEPLNIDDASQAVREMYRYAGLQQPEIAVYPSPWAALTDYHNYLRRNPPSMTRSRRIASEVMEVMYQTGGTTNRLSPTNVQLLIDSVATKLYVPTLRLLDHNPREMHGGAWSCVRALIKQDPDVREVCTHVAKYCHIWFPRLDVAILCDRPRSILMGADSRLHSDGSPAIEWADGWGVYFWKGASVPARAVLETPTRWSIDQERNVEVRRVMIERLGMDKYIIMIGARPIKTDKYGKLYEISLGATRSGDRVFSRFVIVTNSSPEPDGSYKDYVLYVPRTVESPREAVAMTFGLDPELYTPRIQT